jgi:hypothetical protein
VKVEKRTSVLNEENPVRFSRASSAQFGRISTELEKYSSDNCS